MSPVTNNDRLRHHVGNGPEGQVCKHCTYLERQDFSSAVVYKCSIWMMLTRMKSSAASDWRLKWPACAKFEKR